MSLKLVVATYHRWNADLSAFSRVALVAHVAQDGGEGFSSELCLVWHPSTLEELKRLEFTAEELVGAVECVEERFWASEREACRASYVRQRNAEVAA